MRSTDFINRGVRCPVHGLVHTVCFMTPLDGPQYQLARYVCADCVQQEDKQKETSFLKPVIRAFIEQKS